MKREEYTDAQAFLDALHGRKRREKQPRRARGEGTGSRTSALDELARHGWGRYSSNDVTHTMRHEGGAERTAGSYDELLDSLLREVRHAH